MLAHVQSNSKRPDCPEFDNEGNMVTVMCYQNNAVRQCGMRTYVTRICSGKPTFVSRMGKFRNHCTKVADNEGYGTCLVDWRNKQCNSCDYHLFAGACGLFGCGCLGALGSSVSS